MSSFEPVQLAGESSSATRLEADLLAAGKKLLFALRVEGQLSRHCATADDEPMRALLTQFGRCVARFKEDYADALEAYRKAMRRRSA